MPGASAAAPKTGPTPSRASRLPGAGPTGSADPPERTAPRVPRTADTPAPQGPGDGPPPAAPHPGTPHRSHSCSVVPSRNPNQPGKPAMLLKAGYWGASGWLAMGLAVTGAAENTALRTPSASAWNVMAFRMAWRV